ncbi:hypothetical protein EPI10_010531 [Gossypium australe]|uniref:Uncharacterized protein n=1 Tax=Gossypium australe TaxID=47621 RepID=A0A5B6W641_9ROSI|nr:hypothetical protein EPI10_010531 [Gossypium australe]
MAPSAVGIYSLLAFLLLPVTMLSLQQVPFIPYKSSKFHAIYTCQHVIRRRVSSSATTFPTHRI